MDINAFSDGCGAIVSGVQLASASDEEVETIRDAFISHGVVFFRDQ